MKIQKVKRKLFEWKMKEEWKLTRQIRKQRSLKLRCTWNGNTSAKVEQISAFTSTLQLWEFGKIPKCNYENLQTNLTMHCSKNDQVRMLKILRKNEIVRNITAPPEWRRGICINKILTNGITNKTSDLSLSTRKRRAWILRTTLRFM